MGPDMLESPSKL